MLKKLLLLLVIFLHPQSPRLPGPGGESRVSPPVVNTSNSGALSSNTATVTFTAPSAQFGIVAHLIANGTATFASVFDCAGAGPCTTPGTDWFNFSDPAAVCTTTNGQTTCEVYVCQSHLASGSSAITLNTSSGGTTPQVDVEIITGMSGYSCLDQIGHNSNGASTNPTVTTTGNVSNGTEFVIGSARSSANVSAGSGYTSIQAPIATVMTEGSNTAPASGGTATAPWSASSGAWNAQISTWSTSAITPQRAQLDARCINLANATTVTCSMSIFANDTIIVHSYHSSTVASDSFADCTGSSACGASTDTLVASNGCTTANSRIVCEYYICQSALPAGTVAVTLTTAAGSTNRTVEAEAWRGLATSGCFDTSGTGSNAASTNPTATTSGNIAGNNELLIGWCETGSAPTAGTGARQISIQSNSVSGEYYSASPTSGATATAAFSAGSSSWIALASAWKSQ